MTTAHPSSLLRAHRLARAFGTEPAVTGVDLRVAAGEIHALVGLNGAGKTTLMRLLLGMLQPDSGRATLHLGPDGTDVRDAPAATWRGVGHLVESPFLYAELTVTETVRAAARLRGLPAHEARQATDRVIADLALEHWARRRCRTLSLGNRQRVGLACAVVHRPSLLVLDEPTNALDPAGVLRVRRHLVEAAGRGVGVLVSSHHLDEMARIAHRITVMHRGAVIGTLPPQGADLERQFFDMVYAAEGVDPREPEPVAEVS
ncbi:ABC transporter ATP-binding protein [Actinotalea sp. K2]|uniref:ABC transporter ATP-binding protein n=1 Tax=Actinotalea sp. K2 TaxID=2939438 RepID=UPI0020177DEA|nr:ABC transporter ATP-binding protein [Actinotalea sp. K2]MCL3861755.1 ABC transporter ATP-binding protein [Actinotalea sp. K2]